MEVTVCEAWRSSRPAGRVGRGHSVAAATGASSWQATDGWHSPSAARPCTQRIAAHLPPVGTRRPPGGVPGGTSSRAGLSGLRRAGWLLVTDGVEEHSLLGGGKAAVNAGARSSKSTS